MGAAMVQRSVARQEKTLATAVSSALVWRGRQRAVDIFRFHQQQVEAARRAGLRRAVMVRHAPKLVPYLDSRRPAAPPPPPKPCNRWMAPEEALANDAAYLLSFSQEQCIECISTK